MRRRRKNLSNIESHFALGKNRLHTLLGQGARGRPLYRRLGLPLLSNSKRSPTCNGVAQPANYSNPWGDWDKVECITPRTQIRNGAISLQRRISFALARIVLAATAVGATAGAGVVLSLVDRSVGQTPVEARMLVRPIQAVPTPDSAPQTAQMNAQASTQNQPTGASGTNGQAGSAAASERSVDG